MAALGFRNKQCLLALESTIEWIDLCTPNWFIYDLEHVFSYNSKLYRLSLVSQQ